jgi:hypothetical protein
VLAEKVSDHWPGLSTIAVPFIPQFGNGSSDISSEHARPCTAQPQKRGTRLTQDIGFRHGQHLVCAPSRKPCVQCVKGGVRARLLAILPRRQRVLVALNHGFCLPHMLPNWSVLRNVAIRHKTNQTITRKDATRYGRHQTRFSSPAPNSTRSPTRGATSCTPCALAAATARSMGSDQAW